MTTHNRAACCETPLGQSSEYMHKGSYTTLAEVKCYVTGPQDAKKAIYYSYDIFGYTPGTIYGADVLATQGYLIVMPDLLEGRHPKMEWLAGDAEEKRENMARFMSRIQDPKPHIDKIMKVRAAAQKEFPAIEKWGIIGYCWGGKLVALTSAKETPWRVGVQTSPAMVDPEDAKGITIPSAMLASGEEPLDDVKMFGENLNVPKHIEIFRDQPHGWMSGRAELDNSEKMKEYNRGYRVSLEFFKTYF